MITWAHDFVEMKKQNQGHPGLNSIKNIHLVSHSAKLKKMYKNKPLPIILQKEGLYRLEIFLDEGEDNQAVIQYDLVDIKSGNTVWEAGRLFPL
jgi:hypothetical protein